MATYQRLHYIDWIRVLAFLTLILFHCAVPFVENYHWEINNEETSSGLTTVIWWTHQWRLPLLFFISGVGVRFSLRKRSILKFTGERFVRLLIPLVFAMLCITPIQVYFEWLQEGKVSTSYWEFYPSVFDFVPYPDGSLTWSHMWFVAYLFVFTILLLPLFSLAKIKWFNRFKASLNKVFSNPISHLLLASPFVFYFLVLFLDWPEQGSLIGDWFVFCSSITFYFLGFFLSSIESFWVGCLRNRKLFLSIAIVLAVFLIYRYYWSWHESRPTSQDMNMYVYGIVDGIHIWTIILAVIGYTMRYLNFSNKYLRYLTTAVYPFYILHQTIIVASGYYITQWEISLWFKLIVLVVVCIVGVFLLYHFIIRKTILTRVLFGVKWNFKWREQQLN